MTRAAVLTVPGEPLRVEEIDLPPLGPYAVRVRVAATGVCHSDLSLARGALALPVPAVLGHEAAGVVVATGEAVTRANPGDRVVLAWSSPCRACFFCTRGQPYLCESPATVEYAEGLHPALGIGAWAEETVVHENAAVRIGDDVPYEIAALVGCAVTTGVGAVVTTAGVEPGATVTVVGCGGVGLSIVQGARVAGASRIVAVDTVPEKRALARELGATDVLDGSDERAIRALTDGRGTDYAFEAVGGAATIRLAYRVTRRGGTTVVLGAGRKDDVVGFGALELFHQARALVGCVYGSCDPDRDFPRVLDLYRAGRLDLDRLVTRRIGLDDVNDALARMERGEGARSVVVFG